MNAAVVTPEDLELEARIEAMYQAGITAEDSETARDAFYAMGVLISQRSPERIAEMEAKIEGLR